MRIVRVIYGGVSSHFDDRNGFVVPNNPVESSDLDETVGDPFHSLIHEKFEGYALSCCCQVILMFGKKYLPI